MSTFAITLNGDPRQVDDGTTVAALVDELGGSQTGRGIAVALDGEVIPFSAWSSTAVGDGARVEIVVAVGGG